LLEKIQENTNIFPNETRLIIAALDNPIRQAILTLLTQKKELSFSEIQNELNLEKLTLNFHLKKLFSSALIDHYFKHELGNQKYSFYAITPLGTRIITSLKNALTPPAAVNQKTSKNCC
jgi:predicted transcriptional regulator